MNDVMPELSRLDIFGTFSKELRSVLSLVVLRLIVKMLVMTTPHQR